jgi:YVTN family beta-propeller protein
MKLANWASLALAAAIPLLTLPLLAGPVRVYQTNAAGDAVDIIDPATNKVVQTIPNVEAAHGVAFSPDGRRAYFTVEAENEVWAADTKTGSIVGKVALSGHPNNIAVSKNGKYVFAGIAQAPGAVDVIEAATMKNIHKIPVKGAVHNVHVTPDGKALIIGSVAGSMITVADPETFAPLWEHKFAAGVRPLAMGTKADGGTDRLYVQLSGLNGFVVLDWTTHEEVARIEHPKEFTGGEVHSGSPSHGIGIAPDGKTLWANSSVANGVFVYSLPDLKFIGFTATGHTPDWLTFTPDGKRIYIANAGSNSVSAIDIATRKEVARIPVGEVPKRNGTVVLP